MLVFMKPRLRFELPWAFLGFLLVVSYPCYAQHMNEKDSPYAGVVQTVELIDCLSKAKDSSDAKLNSVYQSIRKQLVGSDLDHLTETERLWVKYRDANCSAERALYNAGTAANPAYLTCFEAMTRSRTKEVEITYAVRLK